MAMFTRDTLTAITFFCELIDYADLGVAYSSCSASVRQAMKWASDERRLAQACSAVLAFMHHRETAQLAVDTHGYTDVAMTLARGVGLDLCPRLKELSDRHLFLPRGSEIPENLKGICHATLDPAKAARQWDAMVHLFASVHSGHSSAITVLARYGSAARGDPLYEAMAQVGKLLRTVFLCDYFVNEAFRRELLRVLNRGEAVNALKRAI